MELYLYDFDGTIYDGDSSLDFLIYCYKKKHIKHSYIIKIIFKVIAYKLKRVTVTEAKEFIFAFVKNIQDIDNLISEFWKTHQKKMKVFYLDKENHEHDVIVSASPEFLLKPICDRLKVKTLIASDVDKKTGKFKRPNCRGEEKVIQLNKRFPNSRFLEMYSDSLHDTPLLELAERSYMVKKNQIYDYKPKGLARKK